MFDEETEKEIYAEDDEREERRRKGEFINPYEVSDDMCIRTDMDIFSLFLNKNRTELTLYTSEIDFGGSSSYEMPYDENGSLEFYYKGPAYNNAIFKDNPDLLKEVNYKFDLEGKYHLLFAIATDQDVTVSLNGHRELDDELKGKIDCFSGNGRRSIGMVDFPLDKQDDLDSLVITGSFEYEGERSYSFIIHFGEDAVDFYD